MEALEAVARRYQVVLHGLTHKSLYAALGTLYPLDHVKRTFNAEKIDT